MIKRKPRTAKKTTKKFSFQLGLSGFLSLALLVIIGMAWSFILGVIVGRGYQPEKMAMDMAREVLPEDFPLLTEKNEEVLKAEELEFFDKLKQLPTASPAPSKAETKPAVAPKAPTKTETKPAPSSTVQTPPEVKDEVFVFHYQVAALATMDQAKTVLKQLEPGGFKTSIVTASHEGKTWYRVYVHHQGTVDSATALKEKLKTCGINGVLLRSRTPL